MSKSQEAQVFSVATRWYNVCMQSLNSDKSAEPMIIITKLFFFNPTDSVTPNKGLTSNFFCVIIRCVSYASQVNISNTGSFNPLLLNYFNP